MSYTVTTFSWDSLMPALSILAKTGQRAARIHLCALILVSPPKMKVISVNCSSLNNYARSIDSDCFGTYTPIDST